MKINPPPKPVIVDACPVSGCRNPAGKGGLCRTCRDQTSTRIRRRMIPGGNTLTRWFAVRRAVKCVTGRLQHRDQN